MKIGTSGGLSWLVAFITIGCSGVPSGSTCDSNSAAGSSSNACTGGTSSVGGTTSDGGTATAGGDSSTGGVPTVGGSEAIGGAASGGDVSTGGTTATGGAEATGGDVSTGGTTATGGAEATGGDVSTGGAEAAGGDVSTGGEPATGGATATGGAGTGGAGPYCQNGSYAFCDDFEDGNATGWSPLDQNSGTPGVWTIVQEAGSDGVSVYDFAQTATAATGYHYQVAASAAGGPWGDHTVSAWVKPNSALAQDNTKFGICSRFTGTTATLSSGYCMFLEVDASTGKARLQLSKKPASASMAGLVTSTVALDGFVVGQWYNIALEVLGSSSPVTLNGYVGGQLLITFSDASSPVTNAGYPGLITRQGTSAPAATASFDNVTVTVSGP